jgi:hypothetical protein
MSAMSQSMTPMEDALRSKASSLSRTYNYSSSYTTVLTPVDYGSTEAYDP